MKYYLFPPDPTIKPKEAPLYVNSDVTIDVEEWTGLYPIRKIVMWKENEPNESEAIGVIVLLKNEENKFLRLNLDGETSDFYVSKSSEIAGNKHFSIITEEEDIAGEFVFTKSGIIYYYKNKDQSTTEFYGNSE